MRKKGRKLKRWLRSPRGIASTSAVVLLIGLVSYAVYMDNRRLTVDPASYADLLHLIAHAESKGNYNAYFGNANNKKVKFTDMSIADVLKWQAEYVAQGSPSDAVGRYQIISTTLRGLVQQLGLDTQQKFDTHTQDKLAVALLERRGAEDYINDELSREDFAANLAQEWAALPRIVGRNPESSYYDGDGLNQALVKSRDVLQAIKPISAK